MDWHEYRSRHFIVDTDRSEGSARDLITDLEKFFAMDLQALVGEQVDIPGHVRVMAPANPRLFRELAKESSLGGFIQSTPLGEMLIVVPTEHPEEAREVVAHELGHIVMHSLPNEEMEDQANRFAAEFLMPELFIRNQLYRLDLSVLGVLKKVWRVSMAVMMFESKGVMIIDSVDLMAD